MTDIFLSYSRDDLPTARRFAAAFEREGLTVWWDQTLNPGEAFDKATERALEEAGAVVVLWSKHSVDSRWVRAEATQANSNGNLVPVMIEPCKRPIMFELTHTAELSAWKGDAGDPAWQALLAGVRRFVRKDLPAAPATARPVASRRKKSSRIAIAASVAALLIAGTVLWILKRTPRPVAGTAASVAIATPAAAQDVTLAVLPFTNLSSDPEQEYFSDGLTVEILNQLAKYKDLHVIGPASSQLLKGKDQDPLLAGKQLGAANLLEGSVRKSGDDLRITANLVSSKDGTSLWSETYARKLVDIFAVQEEISKAVAAALRVALAPEQKGATPGGTANVQAYDAYLSALAIGRDIGSFGGGKTPVPALERAVALDPRFANAWATLAEAYAGAKRGSTLSEQAELRRKSSTALLRALELAPQSPLVLGAAVDASLENHDWQGAEQRMVQALSQAPATDYEANRGYAWLLMTVGRAKESYTYWERAKRTEPLLSQPSLMLATSYDMAFDTERSDAEFEHARSLEADQARFLMGDIERAVARRDRVALSKLLARAPSGIPLTDLLREGLTNPTVALAGFRKLHDDPANQGDPFVMSFVAQWAAYFGDTQLALQAVKSLSDLSFSALIWQPGLAPVRKLAGFKDVVRDMGLVDYWRATGNWGDFCKPVGNDDFECH